MSAVNDAVQDRVPKGGIGNDLMPAADRNLAGDEQRALLVPIIDDFQQVPPALTGRLSSAPDWRPQCI